MATNYTTKTAALRATKADMRQVQVSKKIEIGKSGSGTTVSDKQIETDKLMVLDTREGSETYNKRTNVLDLIDKAQTDAANNAGIQVTRDLTGDYDNADADEVLNVKTKKMNFFGSYVNVVQSAENPDEISIYIGENKNPAEFSTVTGPNGSAMYVYADNGSDYSIAGTSGAGKSYSVCQTGGSELVHATASDTIITIPNTTSTIKVEAVDNADTSIKSCETGVIDGSSTTVTKEENGIKIEVYDIHKNTPDDAKDGMTPGFIRCKVKATLTNATIMPNGGFYKIKMTVAGKSNTNSTGIFVYTSPTTNPSIGSVTATYASTGTKKVSGLTYDSGAKVTLEVTGIKDTQWMATKNENRITVSDNSNGRLGDIGNVTVANLTAANSTDKTKKNAEFSYTKEVTFTASHTPTVMTGKYIVTPYKPLDGSAYTTGAMEDSFAGTNYLWNDANGTENDATSSFHEDGKRLPYVVLADANGDVTGLTISSDTYNSETQIVDSAAAPYNKQLLVQGGELKHPGGSGCDVTGTYTSTNCTGTRYWVKKISTGSGTDAKTTFTVTGSNLNASGVKIWAVCANSDSVAEAGKKSLLINALGSAGGFAKSVSSTSLSVEIPGGQMTCTPAACFYLVVQLPQGSTAKLGAITVA